MPVVVVSSKGQIVIPAQIRKKYKINQGDRLEIKEINGKLVLELLPRPFIGLYGAFRGNSSLTRLLQEEHALEVEKEEK
ncbi:AbrB/MazE/SpoVT family DNA-binding domain-containing protein [Desulfurispora thermophila]|uniref:AbrB/MazE/SpoVT family DNA-binding domain-containing protein n=1 Tax=Desulfurispora thermophila TaxID=265470 RepID=UPI0003617B1E|nr:AbrB/MazE/SpoVT family DNA-binding domain-containing protein [Desulfurispora thermophila]